MFLNGDLMAEEFPLHIKSNVITEKVSDWAGGVVAFV